MSNQDNGRTPDRDAPRSANRPKPPSVPPKPKRVSTRMPVNRPSVEDEPLAPTRAMPPQSAATPPSAARRNSPPPSYPPRERTQQARHETYGEQPSRQHAYDAAPAPAAAPPRKRKKHKCCTAALVIVLILAVIFGWLLIWVQGQIQTVPALSGAANTPGDTTLIVGSDSRDGWGHNDLTEGERTDTIMVLHAPESGPTSLISIPRDSFVPIPGYGSNKINAAFSFGGPQLLVETVEDLTGLTIDTYLEVGFTGVEGIVDALGGVELCLDYDVDDEKSGLVWEAGCHTVDGETALAFSRMRYSDPLGDIGRAERQRQVVGAVAEGILSPATLLNPTKLLPVTSATLEAFRVSEGTGVFDLMGLALDMRSALGGNAVTGTPPITSLGYNVDGVGSTVLLTEEELPQFWEDVAEGNFEPGEEVGGVE
ncbi:LCP family protein [Demequina globuliformis]|uniref:LCP family protein n=1 Tax=Demequina globuliformis TaxID=676202 RepID=UPI001F3A14D2|nr:LCP family protein [Demequina globuliformis]